MRDPEQIDRMVDGELNSDAERTLLLDCETNNEWRELALAYVESQMLKREMASLRSEPTSVAAGASDQCSAAPNSAVSDVGSQHAVPKGNRNAWSLAAAILLSLGVGYGMGWGWQSNRLTNPSFATNLSPSNSNGTPLSMQFTVSNPATQELQQFEIPLLEAKDLGADWQQKLQAGAAEDLLREMQSQGLNLRQERTLTPVRLPNGQRVVVPVDYFYEQPFQ